MFSSIMKVTIQVGSGFPPTSGQLPAALIGYIRTVIGRIQTNALVYIGSYLLLQPAPKLLAHQGGEKYRGEGCPIFFTPPHQQESPHFPPYPTEHPHAPYLHPIPTPSHLDSAICPTHTHTHTFTHTHT